MDVAKSDHRAAATTGTRAELTARIGTRRHHRRRLLAIVTLTVLLLLAFAPQIVAWSALRHHLPRLRIRGFEEEIRVGSASLSWWGPIELKDVELDSPDSKPCVTVKRITEDRGVWALLFHPGEPLHVRIEQPRITVLLRPGGSNLEDAFAPVLAHPRPWRPNRERSFEVTDGSLEITDTTTGRTAQWTSIALNARTGPGMTVPARVEVTAKSGKDPRESSLHLVFNQPQSGVESTTPQGSWDAKLEMTDFPMAALGPLPGRWQSNSDLNLSGSMTAEVQCRSDGAAAGAALRISQAEWKMTTTDVEIAWPSRVGPDRPKLGAVRFEGKVSAGKGECRIEQASLVTDICQLHGSGVFPIQESGAVAAGEPDARLSHDPEFRLEGELDLVGLVRLLPATLALRDGARLTEGKVVVHAESLMHDGHSGWAGSLEMSRLAAQAGDDVIAWDEPLAIRFRAHREDDRIEFDELEGGSDFVNLTGRGNSRSAHLEAGCDLDRLAARLRQFFKTDSFEMHGTAKAAIDLESESDHTTAFKATGDVENLLLRRLVATTVQRRRGDVQPIEVEAPPDPLPPPQPAGPFDRRAMRQQRRAERDAQRDFRRRENEARKAADGMIAVPVEEWSTLWTEPRLAVSGAGRIVPEDRRVELSEARLDSGGIRLTAHGSASDLLSRCQVDLDGQAECDTERIVERLRDMVGPHLHISGHESRRFGIHGPLRMSGTPAESRPVVPPELAASGAMAWKDANLFGLEAGPAEIDLSLAKGVLAMRPLELAVSGGKVTLAPRILLNDRPAMLAVPAGPVIENVELTDEVCNSWMQYIAPVMAQATRARGRFSLDLDETQVTLADAASGEASGRLRIDTGQLLPGPLFEELSEMIGQLISTFDRNPPRDLLGIDRPIVELDRQVVEFQLQGRRVFHSPVEFKIRNLLVRTHGSVGIDQTLDVLAEISFSDEFVSRARFLSPLKGRTLELPIQGTLRKPRIDRGAIAQILRQFGQNTIEGLINNGIQKFIDRRQP